MPRLLLAAFVWMVTTLPCQAATLFELGTTPHVSIHLEGRRASVGLGISAFHYEQSFPTLLGAGEIRVWTFNPTVISRLYLSGGDTRSFLEARVTKEIPSVSSDSPFLLDDYDEFYDDWGGSLGFGFRAGINERFRVGGAVDAYAEFETFSDRENTIRGGTAFRVFLDYALSP